MVKKQILKILENSEFPISVPEILLKIKAHKTTIYRELDEFLEEGLINEVDFRDGKKRYELSRNHHHHLICKSCGKIEDVKINEKILLKNINMKSNFIIENHSIEFFGKCKNCITK